ncbi:hypothetical protein SAMN06295912_112113 [Sphingomonas laterariae]|uniref:Uncharacterized protein n=1 Tax=Edaphosphingomonas laterariae TaxID=861865 RepID=A0A239GJW5_9SPHN|nr:hypothetical protein SAMN06295912_112113 [Sphingomonas laterariae]
MSFRQVPTVLAGAPFGARHVSVSRSNESVAALPAAPLLESNR